jgi:hypothetical protein
LDSDTTAARRGGQAKSAVVSATIHNCRLLIRRNCPVPTGLNRDRISAASSTTGALMTPAPPLDGSRYFLTIYGFQTFLNFLRTAHTFAIAKKTTADLTPIEEHIISWLPDGGPIHIFGAEKGRIYTFEETLAYKKRNAIVRALPTEEVTEAFYQSFVDRKNELESGGVQFIMNDSFSTRPHGATNCIHAVSDLPIALSTLPMLDTFSLHGYEASFAVYRHFQRWYLAAQATPPPRIEAGVDAEIMTRERLDDSLVEHYRVLEPIVSKWIKNENAARKITKKKRAAKSARRKPKAARSRKRR